jgi:hypothetical protein
MFATYNNWFKWYYDGVLFGRKQSANSILDVKFDALVTNVLPLAEEIKRTAKKTVELYENKKISVLFSGGLESELVVRTFKDMNADLCAYIFRYENDINIYDVSYAVTISEIYNIPYKIIDFSLSKFYEKDAEKISELSQIVDSRALPQMKFLDYIDDDSLILGGGGEVVCRRIKNKDIISNKQHTKELLEEDIDYTKKGNWIHVIDNIEIGWEKYTREKNIKAIMCWFKFTPEMYLAQLTTEWSKKLRNDGYVGKTGINSTKLFGYREVYPDMLYRIKKYGLENINTLTDEFSKYLTKKFNGKTYNTVFLRNIDDIFVELGYSNQTTTEHITV